MNYGYFYLGDKKIRYQIEGHWIALLSGNNYFLLKGLEKDLKVVVSLLQMSFQTSQGTTCHCGVCVWAGPAVWGS